MEEKAPSAEKLPVKLELRPLEIDASEFLTYAEAYLSKLSHEMRESCQNDVSMVFKQMEEGYERHYITLFDSDNQ